MRRFTRYSGKGRRALLWRRGDLTRAEFLREVKQVFEKQVESLTGNESLSELGWSSLSAVDFVGFCDEKFNIMLDVEQLRQCKNVNDLAALVPLT